MGCVLHHPPLPCLLARVLYATETEGRRGWREPVILDTTDPTYAYQTPADVS